MSIFNIHSSPLFVPHPTFLLIGKGDAFKFLSQIELSKLTDVYILTVSNKFYACRFVFGSSPSHICYSIPHGAVLMHAYSRLTFLGVDFMFFPLLEFFFFLFLRNSLLRNQLYKFLLH